MESAHCIPYARQALNYPVITSYKTRYEKLSHNGSSNQVSPRWQKYYIVTDLLTDLLHSTGCITWHRCIYIYIYISWWRHQMETFSALLAIWAGIHRSPVNSLHKGQWRGALMFSSICSWINGWENKREAGDLRRHRAHYDVTIMFSLLPLRVLSYQQLIRIQFSHTIPL